MTEILTLLRTYGEVNSDATVAASVGILFIVFFLVVASLSIAGFVFWLIMLIHAAQNDIEDKALWLLIILVGQIIGAIVYYFVIKKKFDAANRQPAKAKG